MNTFPGCGSAWYSPSRRIWSRNDWSRRPARTFGGTRVASTAAWLATVTPSISSITSTRRVESAGYTIGAVMPSSSFRISRKAPPLTASVP